MMTDTMRSQEANPKTLNGMKTNMLRHWAVPFNIKPNGRIYALDNNYDNSNTIIEKVWMDITPLTLRQLDRWLHHNYA